MVDELGGLLVKAGNILAPDCFSLAMDGSPIPRAPSTVAAESEGSQIVGEPDGNITDSQAAAAAGSVGNTANSQETVTTAVTEVMEKLEPEVISVLIDKGKKLQQHKAVGQHAKKHLSELGTVDMIRRYVWRVHL